jgi:hypothetical protein
MYLYMSAIQNIQEEEDEKYSDYENTEYEKDSETVAYADASADMDFNPSPSLYKSEKNELNLAIISEDIDKIKAAIKNNIKGDCKSLYYAILTDDNDIIELIHNLKHPNGLNIKKSCFYIGSTEDNLINDGRTLLNPHFINYSKEKIDKKKK